MKKRTARRLNKEKRAGEKVDGKRPWPGLSQGMSIKIGWNTAAQVIYPPAAFSLRLHEDTLAYMTRGNCARYKFTTVGPGATQAERVWKLDLSSCIERGRHRSTYVPTGSHIPLRMRRSHAEAPTPGEYTCTMQYRRRRNASGTPRYTLPHFVRAPWKS